MHSSSNITDTFQPQGLYTYCFLCLKRLPQISTWLPPSFSSGPCSRVTFYHCEIPPRNTCFSCLFFFPFSLTDVQFISAQLREMKKRSDSACVLRFISVMN